MQPFYQLTAVDVRRAEESGSSRATTITKLTMPALMLAEAAHNPGGGVGEVNFVMPRIQAIEPKFEVKGPDVDIFRGFGQSSRWTLSGAYRLKGPGGTRPVPGRAIIEGAISGWEPDESDPAELQGCTHTFKEVTHYELSLDGKELFYWDFWERIFRRDGVDIFEDERRALGA